MAARHRTLAARTLVVPVASSPSRPILMPVVSGGTVSCAYPDPIGGNPAVLAVGSRRRRVRAHWLVSLSIAASAASLYAGFVMLVTFDKALAAQILAPGLSVEVLVAVIIMTMAWLATGLYALWSDRIDAPAAGSQALPSEGRAALRSAGDVP